MLKFPSAKFILYSLVVSFFSVLMGFSVRAATTVREPYQAEVSAGAVTMVPGESKQITLRFKNVGTKAWYRGKTQTAVFLLGDSSVFGHTSWIEDDLPSLIRESRVLPGAMASAVFYVKAPSTPGVYTEKFLLSSAPNAWIKGSKVTVTFTVAKPAAVTTKSPPVVPAVTTTTATTPGDSGDVVPSSTAYRATIVSRGGTEWQLKPLESTTVDVKFKNTGTETWRRSGPNYVSMYTWGPKYRMSAFSTNAKWVSATQPALLTEAEVKPGETGTFRIELRAPETAGSYQEAFHLAMEGKAWIDGGSVVLPIRVPVTDAMVAKKDPAATASTTAASTLAGIYKTFLMLTSHRAVTLEGNGRLQITQGFKNAGATPWSSRGMRLVGVTPSLGKLSNVRDESWLSGNEPVRANGATAPGEIGFVTYTIKAPPKKGEYKAMFQLVADGNLVDGGQIEIPITVTADGYIEPDPPPATTPQGSVGSPSALLPLTGDISTLPNEPIIRVGLYKTTDDMIKVRSLSGKLIANHNGTAVCTYQQGDVVTVSFDRSSKMYHLRGPGCSNDSPGWYVLVADDGVSPLEITDYSRPIAWLPGSNDNKFRSKVELRYTPSTNSVWVINELLLETYLRGIAETSDVSPLEFQKTLLTAARTYAVYHVTRGTKHANEFYHVDAHLDQVYRGYGQEARSPHIVQGVNETRGQIVTYNGKLAITPYYSRSDGRSRDWKEVWGGAGYPWLVSVPIPWDKGQTLWGHGVGMSARGALMMAAKDNKVYTEILSHFYPGTELRLAFK